MKTIIQFAVCFLAVYLCACFIKSDINFTQWNEGARVATIIFSIITFAFMKLSKGLLEGK